MRPMRPQCIGRRNWRMFLLFQVAFPPPPILSLPFFSMALSPPLQPTSQATSPPPPPPPFSALPPMRCVCQERYKNRGKKEGIYCTCTRYAATAGKRKKKKLDIYTSGLRGRKSRAAAASHSNVDIWRLFLSKLFTGKGFFRARKVHCSETSLS